MSQLAEQPAEPIGSVAGVLPALPGEDMESTDAGDARHWAVVYAELLHGLRSMMRSGGMEDDDRLRERADMYARRLLYWRARRWER